MREGQLVGGRYRVEVLLGQGGMGQVYRALQLNLARRVALKLLKPTLSDMPGARARFQREAKVAAALRHHGAVQIFDFGEDEGQLFLAMELLEGQTLRQRLGRVKDGASELSIAQVLEVTAQVAEVLVAAHAIGLVHRDLKPSNIFLVGDDDGEERAIVADFGLAFIKDRDDAGRMTRDGMLAGTPAYISPEQALGRDLSPAVDVYSLGCSLYEMLTGQPPFIDESEVGLVTKHLFSVPKPPRELRSDAETPSALETLCLSMLAKHPAERPSATEVVAALAALRARLGHRERSRDALPLLSREGRMVAEPAAQAEALTLEPMEGPRLAPEPLLGTARLVAVIGPALDESLEVTLAANGLRAVTYGEAFEGAEALFAPGATLETVATLCDADLPVITDTDPDDLERLSALLTLGVDEVLPRPLRAEELARRLHRALRRFRGRRRRQ